MQLHNCNDNSFKLIACTNVFLILQLKSRFFQKIRRCWTILRIICCYSKIHTAPADLFTRHFAFEFRSVSNTTADHLPLSSGITIGEEGPLDKKVWEHFLNPQKFSVRSSFSTSNWTPSDWCCINKIKRFTFLIAYSWISWKIDKAQWMH